MKIRIKANSLRIRLTRPEVEQLAIAGYLEEQTMFANNKFVYAVQSVEDVNVLSASPDAHKITMYVSKSFLKDWPGN